MNATTVKLKKPTRDKINDMKYNYNFVSVNELLEYITNDLDINNKIKTRKGV